MKTSTKIILLFVSLLLAGMLTLYIATKYRLRSEPPKVEWKNRMLEPFSVVVTQDIIGCSISGDENNVISWAVQEKGGPNFLVRNDTLFIQNPKILNGEMDQILIHCKTLRSIIANKGSKISISDLKTGPFSIYGNGSEITINNFCDETEKLSDKTIDLTVVAENLAFISLYNVEIRKGDIKLNRARLITFERVHSQDVSLVLKERSYAEFKIGPMNITLDRDSTSKILIN